MSDHSKVRVFFHRSVSTAVLWAAVSATFISANPWAFVALIFILGAASTYEFFAMTDKANFPTDRGFATIISVLYLAVICIFFAADPKAAFDYTPAIDGAFICGVVLLSFCYQLKTEVNEDEPFRKVACSVIGFLYIAFLFSFMVRLLFLQPSDHFSSPVPGAWLVLWLCIVTKFTDMGAYLTGTVCGSLFKTHKMIPHISPGKTWEGFIGALIIAMLSACGLYGLFPEKLPMLQNWSHVILLGILLPLFAVVGDLAESVVKRSLRIKDSGNFLPGIGGALDLIDSLCFTAPVAYFYLMWSF